VFAGDVPVTYFGGKSKPDYVVGKGGAVRNKRGKGVGHIALLADGAKNDTENSDTVVSSLMMEQSQSKSFINILAVKAIPPHQLRESEENTLSEHLELLEKERSDFEGKQANLHARVQRVTTTLENGRR
jgi:hypothetical protein